ncbi:MAG TPA: methyltransferase domain-containing protein [Solirubrobacteraceae bacterium]|jgi:SAM-dependent methyltransferase|nr:methyltransferase domain-containing protein [Solirubrobacteraceae bacterium]
MSLPARTRDAIATLLSRASVAPAVLRLQFRRRRLARRYLKGEGLEIGALHYPLWVPSGVRVRYVDRMDVADLHGHYPELPLDKLVAVDVVDDGERLSSQPDGSADFVIANHFIEHTEDPLEALANHLRVLRPGGVVFMAVPDRRRTFDERRSPTPIEHIVEDHLEGPARSRRVHQEEWARLVEQTPESEVAARADELEREDYSIHFHVWAPWEFTALLDYARNEGRLPFAVEELKGNEHEFIAILRRT